MSTRGTRESRVENTAEPGWVYAPQPGSECRIRGAGRCRCGRRAAVTLTSAVVVGVMGPNAKADS
jgi:hypothetical protein